MSPRLYECTSFDTVTATCTEAVWRLQESWLDGLTVEDVKLLLGLALGVFAMAWAVKMLTRAVRD